jgi:hypothetical protein
MASNGNKTVLVVVVVVGLLSMVVAGIVGVAGWMMLSTSPESTMPEPQAVSVEIEPEVALPGAGVEPTFAPNEREEILGDLEEGLDRDPRTLTPELYAQMSAQDIVEAMSSLRLSSAGQWDRRVPLDGDLSLDGLTISQGVYSGAGALTYLVGDFATPVYTQMKKPNECMASWGDDTDWDYFNEPCQRIVYDEMIRIKYGRPLYRDLAKLDDKTLALILKDLDAIGADTPMLGSTAAHVYQAVAPAVHDYLLVWEAMGTKGRKSMHARYKKKLKKRGVLRKGNATRDMVSFYYDLNEDDMPEVKGLHEDGYTHTIIGFWMRRIDDGTADDLVGFMRRSETKFGK